MSARRCAGVACGRCSSPPGAAPIARLALRAAARTSLADGRRRGARRRRRAPRASGRSTVDVQVDAVEQRAAEPAAVAGEVRGRCSGTPGSPRPHGHGFVAATSMQRVGNSAARWPRTIVTCRPRAAGAAPRAPSARTPTARRGTARRGGRASPRPGRGARRRRPGRTRRSCGAARGRAAVDQPAARRRPATLWMRVTSIASVAGQRRQDRGQPPREHRLARARRAVQEQVVAAGRGDLSAGSGASCPRTSRRSAPSGLARRRGRCRRERGGGVAAQDRRHRARSPTPATATPSTSAASPAHSRGTMSPASPWRRAPSATASAPRHGRSSPPSDSSPKTAQRSTRSAGTGRSREQADAGARS